MSNSKRKTPMRVTAVDHKSGTITFESVPDDIKISDWLESDEGAVCLVQGPKVELNFVREHWLKRLLLWPVRKWHALTLSWRFERAFKKAMKK